MAYIRITIHLRDGTKRSGVRSFSGPFVPEEIRMHAWRLSAEVLGHQAKEDVTVQELPPDDPAKVTLILKEQTKVKTIPRSGGGTSLR
jgi:hypothetical protein